MVIQAENGHPRSHVIYFHDYISGSVATTLQFYHLSPNPHPSSPFFLMTAHGRHQKEGLGVALGSKGFPFGRL